MGTSKVGQARVGTRIGEKYMISMLHENETGNSISDDFRVIGQKLGL